MKSFIFNIIGAILAAVSITSCSPSIESVVEEANQHCPINLRGMGKIESLDFENNTLTYNCLITTRSFNLAAMEGHEETMKYAFLPMLPNILNDEKNARLTQKLIDDNSSLAFHFYSKGLKNPRLKGPKAADVTVTFTPEELKQVVDGKIDDSPETKLKTQIAIVNLQLPQRIDSETTFTSLETKDKNVVYNYDISESDNPQAIQELTDNTDALRQSLSETMHSHDRDIRQTIEMCKQADYGIVYRYTGVPSGRTLEIRFTPSEL